MAYRDNTTKQRAKAIVHYRPMNALATIAIVAVIVLLSGMTYFQALLSLRSVDVTCVRGGEHTCTVLRHYGPITTHQALPINAIHSVSVSSHRAKNSTNYATILVLKGQDTVQLMRAGARGAADARRVAVDKAAFDPQPGTSTVHTDDAAPISGLFLALLATGLAAMSLLFTRSARLEFDFDRGTVAYKKSRWPLPPVRRTLRADEVKRALVTSRPGSKGGTVYEVELDLAHGPNLVLVGQGGGTEKRHKEAEAAINALLAKLHEEQASPDAR
jgi:hypothetical protein